MHVVQPISILSSTFPRFFSKIIFQGLYRKIAVSSTYWLFQLCIMWPRSADISRQSLPSRDINDSRPQNFLGTNKMPGVKSQYFSMFVDEHVPKFSYFWEHMNIFGQGYQYIAPVAHSSTVVLRFTGIVRGRKSGRCIDFPIQRNDQN